MNIDKVPYNLKTDRDVFNHVRDHLLEQNQQSMYQSGGCVYRGSNGLSCAIGCLIADEHYDEDNMENEPVTVHDVMLGIDLSNPEWNTNSRQRARAMLFFLQRVHDDLTPYTWESDLNYLESILFEPGSDSLREEGVYYGRLEFKYGRILDRENKGDEIHFFTPNEFIEHTKKKEVK